jgi:hypothetical protein
MRIIDKTPFAQEDGTISAVNRIQGTLQNGFSWYGNLQAQSKAVAFFEKQLDKKFTLIRNNTLGASKITIPFILIGPPGIHVFMVTNLEGTYRAKGNNWGKTDGEKYKESSVNLLKRTSQFSRAVDRYLEQQGFALPKPSTPILLAINSGIHIETIRPSVRIVMSDALDRFAVELRQSPPIMVVGDVHQVAEALTSPLRKKKTKATHPPQQKNPKVEDVQANAPNTKAKPDNDLGFSFEEEIKATQVEAQIPVRQHPDQKKARRKKRKKAPSV